MGRPATAPKKLKDGFYIEVRNKGSKSGVKIRTEGKQGMMDAKKEYEKNKDVITLGEHKDGKWI
jgi:hypothetical protein